MEAEAAAAKEVVVEVVVVAVLAFGPDGPTATPLWNGGGRVDSGRGLIRFEKNRTRGFLSCRFHRRKKLVDVGWLRRRLGGHFCCRGGTVKDRKGNSL